MAIIFGDQLVVVKEQDLDFTYSTLGISDGTLIDLGGGKYVQFGPGILGALYTARWVAFISAPSATEETPATLPITADPPFPPVWPYTWNTSLVYGREHLGQNMKMIRGDSYEFRVTITLDGDTVDITGGDFTMTAKWDVADSDANAVFQKTVGDGITLTDPTNGVITVKLEPADTNSLPLHTVDLFYDIQYIDTDGDVHTVLNGTLQVQPDVTTS